MAGHFLEQVGVDRVLFCSQTFISLWSLWGVAAMGGSSSVI